MSQCDRSNQHATVIKKLMVLDDLKKKIVLS